MYITPNLWVTLNNASDYRTKLTGYIGLLNLTLTLTLVR